MGRGVSESTPKEPEQAQEPELPESSAEDVPDSEPPAPPAKPTETNDEYRARLKREADRILREKMEDFYARVGIV